MRSNPINMQNLNHTMTVISYMVLMMALLSCNMYNTSNSYEDSGEAELVDLLDTTWVSLSGQSISGVAPETSHWYTLDIDKENARLGGRHFFIYNDNLGRGNSCGTDYEIDEEGKLNVSEGVACTRMLPPVREDFAFMVIQEYRLEGDRLIITYKGPRHAEEQELYELEFEPLREGHIIYSRN